MGGEWGIAEAEADRPTRAVEILNFAIPGHAPGQRWEHFTRVGWETAPDLILFEGTLADLGWDERRLRALIPRGLGLDAPVYQDVLTEIGITPNLIPNPSGGFRSGGGSGATGSSANPCSGAVAHGFADEPVAPEHQSSTRFGITPDDLKARLRPHRESILSGVYRRVVADCQAKGIPVAWVLLPRVGKPVDPEDRARINRLAKAAGFDRTVDLSDVFDGRPASSLAIAPDDFHPNAEGHALLARRIDAALMEFLSSSARSSRPLQ
ncbi:MAG TPA: SGNH/GDSL hydrolase family protein [Isosphaeraceae bacterium]